MKNIKNLIITMLIMIGSVNNIQCKEIGSTQFSRTTKFTNKLTENLIVTFNNSNPIKPNTTWTHSSKETVALLSASGFTSLHLPVQNKTLYTVTGTAGTGGTSGKLTVTPSPCCS